MSCVMVVRDRILLKLRAGSARLLGLQVPIARRPLHSTSLLSYIYQNVRGRTLGDSMRNLQCDWALLLHIILSKPKVPAFVAREGDHLYP